MKIKIYQSYYDDSHIEHLDQEFSPLDNRNSPTWYLNEQPIQVRCYDLENSTEEKSDLWGLFSWAWKNKFTGLQAKDILNQINDNPGYDVYLFNPFGWLETISYNMWEQGESCHPHLIPLAAELFPLMGLSHDLLIQPMDCTNTCWGSYYVGNDKFWKEWMQFGEKYINSIPKLSPTTQQIHNSSANYKGFDYFPFVYERLFSTFLLANKGKFNVYHYQHNSSTLEDPELRKLKADAILEKNMDKLKEWNERSLNKLINLHPSATEHLSIKYSVRKGAAEFFMPKLVDWDIGFYYATT